MDIDAQFRLMVTRLTRYTGSASTEHWMKVGSIR
jgi:hypothetical protein